MKRILTLITLALTSNLIFSQINPKKCITTNIVEKELKHNPEYESMRQSLLSYHQKNKDFKNDNQTTIIIPVVIHIVHRNSHTNIGSGINISNAQIEDQLRILNEDYSKTNPEVSNPPRTIFSNYWGNPDLQFCLATTDPNGNPTTGITRTATNQVNWDA
ncbi:MAG: hypothetical protein P8M34_07090, partial [Saprospiraceae bacterium]|nr:hypothetical protein [Saprospiraceae bacterium]